MSNNAKVTKSITNFITYLLFAVLILGLLGGVMYLLNRPSGIYVVYGAENITDNNNGIIIDWSSEESEVTFTIQNSEDWGVYTVQDCTVKVVPNVVSKNDFEFTADGETNLFSNESDLTAAFVADYTTYDGNGFTITEDGGFTMHILPYTSDYLTSAMSEILSRANGGAVITVANEIDLLSTTYFALQVISPDGSSVLTVPFKLSASGSPAEITYLVSISSDSVEYVSSFKPSLKGNAVGYITSDGTLTVEITAKSNYYIYAVGFENATLDSKTFDNYNGGNTVTLVISNPTDNVVITVLVSDAE